MLKQCNFVEYWGEKQTENMAVKLFMVHENQVAINSEVICPSPVWKREPLHEVVNCITNHNDLNIALLNITRLVWQAACYIQLNELAVNLLQQWQTGRLLKQTKAVINNLPSPFMFSLNLWRKLILYALLMRQLRHAYCFTLMCISPYIDRIGVP